MALIFTDGVGYATFVSENESELIGLPKKAMRLR
jgi:hypothetical protein